MRHPPGRRTAEFGKFESFVGGRRGCDRGRLRIALATAIMARVIIARMNIAGVVIAAVIDRGCGRRVHGHRARRNGSEGSAAREMDEAAPAAPRAPGPPGNDQAPAPSPATAASPSGPASADRACRAANRRREPGAGRTGRSARSAAQAPSTGRKTGRADPRRLARGVDTCAGVEDMVRRTFCYRNLVRRQPWYFTKSCAMTPRQSQT